ncbi:MAG: F0F1 ATP synthase subunit B [Saprospiraceae bacterium]|nr:F0F1 ATP synthase subunit B [Saprospiraceae bacterium]MCB9324180.1 F0F1 ATP synthase subunit B [Lewinellaceae bacterium]
MTEFIFLAGFDVIKPDPGLIFWTSLIFIAIWWFVGKKAFRPIQEALKKREHDIQHALDEAKKARQDVANVQASNDRVLAEAREERSAILKEASAVKDAIIKEAREKAKEDAQKIVANAKIEIDNQRKAAITDLKNQAGLLAIEMAEKLIRKELKGDAEQDAFMKKMTDELKLN